MTDKIKDGASYDDIVAAPDDLIAELVEGSLYFSPRPAIRHANATSVLGGYLNPAFQRGSGGPGGWWIFDEPELHLDGDVLVPDLAGWKRERMPGEADVVGVTIVPDWVCETVSPSTERFDRRVKLPRYAAAGVAYLWVVDPVQRTLDVLRSVRGTWRSLETHAGAARVSAPPFEAIAIDLATLWA